MVVHDLTDNPIADASGKLAFFGSIFMNIWNWLNFNDINQFFVVLTTIGGLIYISLKIYSVLLDIREKKKNNGKNKF
jgi:hypothetical protein